MESNTTAMILEPSNKRPRSPSSDLPPAKVAKTSMANHLQINYLSRLNSDNLPLVHTNDNLPAMLHLIGEYEAVLQRHESIAGNLGACPLGPILLKRFERLFDGPPQILKSHGKEANVAWLDVVDFARNKPEQFNLEKMRNGVRVCQFYTKQCRVEISEEDYVLIASGMPQKLIPPQPIMEDEEKELGALEILEKNLGQIVQLADQLSGRARQLNHKLGNRKNAILRRREAESDTKGGASRSYSSPLSPAGTNGYFKQPQIHNEDRSLSPPTGFTAVNMRQSAPVDGESSAQIDLLAERQQQTFSEANTGNVTIINGKSIKGASPALRAELMKKFFAQTDRETRAEEDNRRASFGGSRPHLTPGSSSKTKLRSDSIELIGGQQVKVPSTVAIPSTPVSLLPHIKPSVSERDDGGPFKLEMVTRMESMHRGERVIPPCDRCRRLHMDCLKNLTACMGCTKKHAKCSWKDVRVEELQNGRSQSDNANAPANHELVDEFPNIFSPINDTPTSRPRSDSQPSSVRELPRDDDESSPKGSPPLEKAVAIPEVIAEEKTTEIERPRFDVRPPPIAQQLRDATNGRGNFSSPYSFFPQVKDSIEHDENDEGDRLQALAAQVYRSASQSVRPQEG